MILIELDKKAATACIEVMVSKSMMLVPEHVE